MIMKLLLIIGVVAFIYFLFIKKKPISTQTNEKNKENNTQTNDMIECFNCGIYCEIDDTIISNNKYYCSKECLEES